jgi:hypothetical protein
MAATAEGMAKRIVVLIKSSRAKVDEISFRFVDLPQMWQFADLRFADHVFLGYCEFAIPIIFCGLKNFRKSENT